MFRLSTICEPLRKPLIITIYLKHAENDLTARMIKSTSDSRKRRARCTTTLRRFEPKPRSRVRYSKKKEKKSTRNTRSFGKIIMIIFVTTYKNILLLLLLCIGFKRFNCSRRNVVILSVERDIGPPYFIDLLLLAVNAHCTRHWTHERHRNNDLGVAGGGRGREK